MERVGRHFLLGPLRIDQWRRYHVLHLRHHLKQMSALRATLSVEVQTRPADGKDLAPQSSGVHSLKRDASGFLILRG